MQNYNAMRGSMFDTFGSPPIARSSRAFGENFGGRGGHTSLIAPFPSGPQQTTQVMACFEF